MSERDTTALRLGRRGLLGAALALLGCDSAGVLPANFPKAPRCASGCVVADVHCHVFNGSDLPIEGFLSAIALIPQRLTRDFTSRLQDVIHKLAPNGSDELRTLLELQASGGMVKAPPALTVPAELLEFVNQLALAVQPHLGRVDFSALVQRITQTLATVARPRHLVAAEMIQRFATVDLFLPLLVDYDYWTAGHPDTPLADQLRVHSRLSALSLHGRLERSEARLHPFAPFNPLREVREVIENLEAHATYDPLGRGVSAPGPYECTAPPLQPSPGGQLPSNQGALILVRHAIERLGFAGVKLYPPVGFLPLDNASRGAALHGASASGLGASLDLALRALYAYCEAEQVPILAHTANSNGYQPGYGQLAEPLGWEPVLREFPQLRLCFGHFGHVDGLGHDETLSACSAWMRRCGRLMQHYPNVFADMSSSPLPYESGFRERYLALLKELFERFPRTRQRLMYGSDFWLSKLDPNHEYAVDAFHEALSSQLDEAAVRRIMGGNALAYLGLVNDDEVATPENRNRKRLLAFYAAEGAPPPAWALAQG